MKNMMSMTLACIMLTLGFSMTQAQAASSHHKSTVVKHHRAHAHKIKSSSYTGVVDLNNANLNQLASLKGVGVKKAKAIIAYRKSSGRFDSVKSLQKVKGIGVKFIARLVKNNPNRIVSKKS